MYSTNGNLLLSHTDYSGLHTHAFNQPHRSTDALQIHSQLLLLVYSPLTTLFRITDSHWYTLTDHTPVHV